jgi:hypothetical protein
MNKTLLSKCEELLLGRLGPFLVLAVLTACVWGQTARFEFVWDDEFLIRDLKSIRGLQHIPEMFYRLDAQSSLPEGFVLFRPVRTLHYALLYLVTPGQEARPWIYHLANVVWHGATAMMLFAVACTLLPRLKANLASKAVRIWSLVLSCAFAVHPVVSEVVCWAKSLDDILAAFFTLAALRQLLKSPLERRELGLGVLFFGLAVYSKESAVPFVAVAFVVLWRLQGQNWQRAAARTGWFFLVALVFVVHRHMVIGRTSQTSPISGSYGQTLVDMLPVVLQYFRLLLGVPPFCIDYTYMRGGYSFFSQPVLGGLALLVSAIILGYAAWRKPHTWNIGFGLLWAGLFLLPVSNLVPMMQFMAERFLYLPLIGWLLAVAGIVSLLPRPALSQSASLLVVCLWAITAWNRSWIWQDPVTLFVRSSQENPKTERVEQNAVAAILHLPTMRKVFSYDERSKQLAFQESATLSDRINALRAAEIAYRLFPEDPIVLSCYGVNLAVSGDASRAVPYLEKAAGLQPTNLSCLLNIARAELDSDQLPSASATLKRACELAPEDPAFLQLRFRYFCLKQDYPCARQVLLSLRQIMPSDENARWFAELEKKLPSSTQSP